MSVNEEYFNSATIESMVASKRSEKWGDYPPDVIALWECETDFEIAPEILDALKEGIENPATFYMGHKKIREHKDRIAAKIELRNGLSVTADDIMLTPGVSAGMWLSIQYACKPGEEIIVPNPNYGPFFNAIDRTKTKKIYWNLYFDEGFKFDIERLKELLTNKTKLIMLCNPHNPSGKVMTKEELKGIADVAVDNDIAVWVDELHEDIIYDGYKHISLASLNSEIERLTMTSWGFSKTHNLAGLRTGYLCTTNKEIMERLNTICKDVVYRDPPTSTLVMEAYPVLLDNSLNWYKNAMMKHLKKIRRLCIKRLDEIPKVTHIEPEATYVIFPKFDYGMTSDELNEYLTNEGRVRCSSGTNFGPGGEGHLRIVFATSEAIINEAFDRIQKALNNL